MAKKESKDIKDIDVKQPKEVKEVPNPALVKEAELKKAKEEQKKKAVSLEKQKKAILKDAVYSVEIPEGVVAHSSDIAYREFAKEAGITLLVTGAWTIEDEVLPNGITIRKIVNSKK